MNLLFLFSLEVVLVLSNILFWLGPLFISLKKGIFNPLHPQFMTPLWIVYFILNVMMQKWFMWVMSDRLGMLKTTSEAVFANQNYYIMPLIIVALCAPFYHLGVKLFCNSIFQSSSDRIMLTTITQVVSNNTRIPFVILGFFVSGLAFMPNYFIPNADFGTFWTYPLAMTNAFLPLMIFCVNKPLGLLSYSFSIISALVMASKASFLYPLLAIFFYYSSRFILVKLKSWIMIFIFFSLSLQILFFGFHRDVQSMLVGLLHRDYPFETFAALVNEATITGVKDGPYKSWTLAEIETGIPTILYPDKRLSVNPSHMVASQFLPNDYEVQPDTYFARFLLFAGYYDLGIIGAIISALGFGALYGWFWSKTKRKIIKSGYLWPLFLYLPIPTIATYFVACGGYTYGFINALVPSSVIFVVVIVSRFSMPVALNCRRSSLDIAN